MNKRELYEQQTEELVMPLVLEKQYELVDVEYVREAANWYLRIFIDKEGGITVDDCELVSRALSDLLDEKDFIPDAYILEVSSPGLGRQLKKDKDLKRSLGEEIEIKLYKPLKREKDGKYLSGKELRGFLTGFDDEKITVKIEDQILDLARNDIAVIKLALDF